MRTSHGTWWASSVLAILACLGSELPNTTAVPAETTTLEQIKAAWDAREKACRQAELTWREEYHLTKGSLSAMWAGMLNERRLAMQNPDGGDVPPADMTFTVNGVFRIRDTEMFAERDAPEWSITKKRFAPTPAQYSFDRTGYREIHPAGFGDTRYPVAHLLSRKVCVVAGVPWCRPIACSLRPGSSAFRTFSLDELDVTGRRVAIRDTDCVEVQIRGGGMKSPRSTLWLDISNGYLPSRIVLHHQGKIIMQTDLHHERGASGQPVLRSWQMTHYHDDGRLWEEIKATVLTWVDRVEGSLTASMPPKARVYDESRPQGTREYITREDGGEVPIRKGDLRKSYDTLVNEMSRDMPRAGTTTRMILFWLLLVGIVTVAVLAAWRFRNRL